MWGQPPLLLLVWWPLAPPSMLLRADMVRSSDVPARGFMFMKSPAVVWIVAPVDDKK